MQNVRNSFAKPTPGRKADIAMHKCCRTGLSNKSRQVSPSGLKTSKQFSCLGLALGEASALDPWVAVGDATLEVIADTTPVSSALPNSLQVTIPSDASGAVGASNTGYWGAHTSTILSTRGLSGDRAPAAA